MESAISKFLIWGGGGGKFGVENAVSNLEFGGGGKFGVGNAVSNLEFGGGGKFGVENAVSNLEFGGGGVENLGWKMLSRNF